MALRIRATALCNSRSSTVGMPERPRFAVTFGNLDPPHRRGLVLASLEPSPQIFNALLEVRFKLRDRFSIDAACPLRLSCRHVSRRKSGVSTCAREVKRALGSRFALAAIFSSCVDILVLPLRVGDVSLLKSLALRPRFPMYAAFPRAEYYQGLRLPPRRLPSYGWSFQLAYSAPRQDHDGSPRFL